MAARGAHRRLTKEYQLITAAPPPFIEAHPSESNILEWHYLLTGPPDTPYHDGQFWGTLTFPPTYPFAPPAIRMHTPSGRFQTSTRLCLSISDFHPKSFNPAWEVSTILVGLLSFMTGEEMTTGGLRASDEERRVFAARSRWWNSTGGGRDVGAAKAGKGVGAIIKGDGGRRFREEFPEVHLKNLEWMEAQEVDFRSGLGKVVVLRQEEERRRAEERAAREKEARLLRQGWVGRHKVFLGFVVFLAYAFISRLLS